MEYQDLIKKQLENVPPQVRHYLESDAYPRIMRSIIDTHNLHLDTAKKVETETTLLLIGLVSPNDYKETLITNAGLTNEQANAIVSEMNEQVFKPILASYKKPEPAPVVNAFAEEVANEEPEEGSGAMREPETPVQVPVETPAPEKKIEKKYAIDPYREPIE
ncbi:MAG: hypothetical protein ACJKSS_00695 [Patescibacteria group bacterium UBA2103]